jgi:hypothetical protein
VSTHERELTAPVDLCTPDGRRLNPDARGWSRHPLHRANLRGRWGRTKRWDYWAVLADDLAVSVTYANVDYLGLVSVWWADLAAGTSGGRELTLPLARGITLPERPGSEPLRWDGSGITLEIAEDSGGAWITADWRERDGRLGRLAVSIAPPDESVNVVIPWSDTRFQYTSKHQARPVHGELTVGARTWQLGDDAREAWGVLDVGRGRWPYRTRWNWGGGAGRTPDGQVVGLQLGGKWTVGTGATENGILVDGVVVKLGDELDWRYDWKRPLEPWRVTSPDGALDVTLAPRFDRHAKTQAVLLATEVHQVFGTWTGQVPAPDGGTVRVEGALGFAEESRSRW